jgi:MFS family permease
MESSTEKESRPSFASDSDRREAERQKEIDVEQGRAAASPEKPVVDGPALAQAAAAAKPQGPGPVPDGGLEAWLQIAGSWAILLASWGLVNTFGVYQTYYETQLLADHTSSDISWIGSLQACLLLIVGVFAGPVFDAGYFKLLISSGLFFIVFGMFMTSLCHTYWQVILAQGITVGIGCGLAFLPSAAILAQYWAKHRALAIGLASTGSPIGGIIFPIIFSRLEPSIGFGWATRVIAFILLGTSIIPVFVMHTRVPPSGKIRSLVDRGAFKDVPYLFFAAGGFFSFMTLYVTFFYIQLYGELHGLADKDFAPYLVTFVNVGSVFGRIAPNALGDAFGGLNVLAICTFVSGILTFIWLGIHNLPGLIVYGILYGIFSGGVVSLTPSVVVGMAPDPSRIGARMGLLFLLAGISVLVGTPIGGAVLGDFTERRWQGLIGYGAAGMLLGSFCWTASRYLIWKKKGHWKA